MKRRATRKLIQTFLEREVVRRRGSYVIAVALYATFVARTGADTSAQRFFRIAHQHGFSVRRALGGAVIENVALKGVWP